MDIVFNCLCPCIVLGQMRTKTSRESEYFQSISIGSAGCCRCIFTSMLSCFLYPVSPFLGLYLCHEREKMLVIYKTHSNLRHHSTYEKFASICCWQNNLLEQKQFLQLMEENGTLAYDWDVRTYKDHLRIPSPEILTVRIFIYGHQSSAKSQFFRKLLCYTESSPQNGINESDSSVIEADYDSIPIGIKSLAVKQNVMKCLEVWNVTESSMDSYAVRHHLPSIDAAIFFIDTTHSDDSNETISPEVLRAHDRFVTRKVDCRTKCICVAPQSRGEHNALFHYGSRSSLNISKVNPHQESLEKARQWAHDNHYSFLTISMTQNTGFASIYSFLNDL